MFERCGWVILLLAAACSEEAPPSLDGVGAPVEPPRPRAVHDPNAELYDDEGVPRESDARVAGLALPRGLTKVDAIESPRRHVYTSAIPPERLLRYFGPRLMTMNVEQRGHAVVYHDAEPRGVRGGVVRLDVTIEPTSRHPSRVEIVERPPAPPEGTVIPESEIRRHFESQRRQAE
jgi:hypothetical protein